MTDRLSSPHEHVFLGQDHERNERRTTLVIAITATMMVVEIVGGTLFGSMALVADGWHMSTHAAALLIAVLAYRYARRNARNPRFTFGTGKLGDLAGFASAFVLALVALLIGWESLLRLQSPVPISFSQAIAVATVGLAVNLLCAWLLRECLFECRHPSRLCSANVGEEGRVEYLRVEICEQQLESLRDSLKLWWRFAPASGLSLVEGETSPWPRPA